MHLSRITLNHFRNYENITVNFDTGFNIILGSNGQGKTNLVEAIGFLSTLESHRIANNQALIQQHKENAIIRTQMVYSSRELSIDAQINRNSPNKAQINRQNIKFNQLPYYIKTVFFAPEDVILIRGEPQIRRKFLDDVIIQRNPRFLGIMNDYDRVVKQRNSLLKSLKMVHSSSKDYGMLDVWNEKLIEYGSQIIDARLETVKKLQEPLKKAYLDISGKDHDPNIKNNVNIYDKNISQNIQTEQNTKTIFHQSLLNIHEQEKEKGVTLIGPHRDDIFFSLKNFPVKGYASHGETWSFILSLRIACAYIFSFESKIGDPVIILDDVFSELDSFRRQRLIKTVSTYEQIFVTASVKEDIPNIEGKKIYIHEGKQIEV